MEIHNIAEDSVFSSAETIFNSIKEEGNPTGLCLCDQCKLDTICYTLNRIEPHYIVSNRGFTRIEQDWVGRQQSEADIAALVYNGLRLVSHNMRPTSTHDDTVSMGHASTEPVFDIPTIVGRLFDGETFAPISDATVELLCSNNTVTMRNLNWQNPYALVVNTPGTFTFWPTAIPIEKAGVHRMFEYSLKIEAPQYESLTHFFKIPAVSAIQSQHSRSVDKIFKLPYIYLFHPGEAEHNG